MSPLASEEADTQEGAVPALAVLLGLRDGPTAVEAQRAAALAEEVAERLGMDGAGRRVLHSAAQVYDLGKVGVPDAVLRKPGRLEPDEWALMRCHPAWGAEVLSGVGLHDVAHVVRFHHERWDGGGYPDGLVGEDIPQASLVIGACEAYIALTADRPYRPALSSERAQVVLRAGAGTSFAPEVIAALLEVLEARTAPEPLPRPWTAAPRARAERPQPPSQGLHALAPALAATTLPVLAESRQRVLRLAEEPQPPLRRLMGIIESDPGLACAVVAAANRTSAKEVLSVSQAVLALGAERIAATVAEIPEFDVFERVGPGQINPERFRLHAVETCRVVRRLGKLLDHPAAGDLALAALLHDVGKLVLARAVPGFPGEVHGAARTPEQRVHAERRALNGVDHAAIGRVLLARWGLPDRISDLVGGHHDEEQVGDGAILRLADLLAHYSSGTPVDPAEVLRCARRAQLPPAALRAVMFDLHGPASSATAPDYAVEPSPLTDRETATLRGLATGRTYREIGEDLGVAVSTIRSHAHNVFGKLGVADRAQAVLLATDRGWL